MESTSSFLRTKISPTKRTFNLLYKSKIETSNFSHLYYLKLFLMKRLVLGLVALFVTFSLQATEGMWIPTLLGAIEDDMQAFGLELSADDIYSVNHSSLKDAIVHFNGGCTAEVISKDGLLLTNHHCGYSQIQYHSSVENNYLKNGFWAKTRSEELVNPSLFATFIVRIDDVTKAILEGVTAGMSPSERAKIVSENEKTIVEAALKGMTNMDAYVRAYNYGNSYFVILTKTYTDVRLVGAPPSAIGKFGGDTDNWMWPRHTGDFSMFRIYADEKNEPADYQESNRPLQPLAHLPVSMDGVEEGDFTMVFGFPGRTEQYLPPSAVEYVVNVANPIKIHMRETSLAIIDEAMKSSDKIQIQYAAKQSSISNAYKKWIGQNKGLKELNALGQKKELNDSYNALASVKKLTEYTDAIAKLAQLNAEIEDTRLSREVFIEYFFYGPEIFGFARSFDAIVNNYDKLESEGKLEASISGLKSTTEQFFKDFHQPTEEAIFEALTALYFDYMPPAYTPEEMLEFKSKNKGDVERMKKKLYGKSIFTNQQALIKLLENPSAKAMAKLKKDPAFMLYESLFNGYLQQIRPEYSRLNSEIDEQMRIYVRGLEELFPNKNYSPDANSTLRLTYGKAEGSSPVDGMAYTFCTTADGILEKYYSGNPDYDLPEDLVKLLELEKYGRYAHEDGELRICFTGSNHTTGGNSGSPAINGKGQLIGLNFDRSWESTMSDIFYDPGRCRNIMVDIKYVLWVIDVYAGAGHLVDEMTLVWGTESPEIETPELELSK